MSVDTVLDRVRVDFAEPTIHFGVPIQLAYDPADPYAVTIWFAPDNRWNIARAVLRDGLDARSGLGDIKVWPCPHRGRVAVRVSSPDGTALFDIGRDDLEGFLARTYRLVPAGRETEYLDVETACVLLLAKEPF